MALQVAQRLKERAKEIIFQEFEPSHYEDVDKISYLIWAAHGLWMSPWMPSEKTEI